jgi:hypothetical protein
MGVVRVIIAFLALVLLIIALAFFVGFYSLKPTGPRLAMDIPAGLDYKGPETTALAGYYCIKGMNSSNGYSIQLNAELDNGLGVQNVYGTSVSINGGPWQPALVDNVWTQNANGMLVLLHANNPLNTMINAPCAWLIIALKNGYAYFGYSLDGRSITWYDSYFVNATYITTTVPGLPLHIDYAGIVLAGAGNGEQAQLGSGTLVYLSLLLKWSGLGTSTRGPLNGLGSTMESVNHAWVFTNCKCDGVISWPSPVNNTQCPGPPSFKP